MTLPRKAQALLAYLALAGPPTHPRSKLAALLWSDAEEEDARNNLRQVLFRTRRALGTDSRVLTVDTPIGKQKFQTKDHQANRAQFWGKMEKDPRYPFAVMSPPVYIDPTPFMD